MAEKKNFYPHLVIKNNEKPNKLYAFPFIGLFIKIVLLVPVLVMYWGLNIAYFVLWTITPFVILFTGKYWDNAYQLNTALLLYSTKITLFVYGLTDKYPGFTLNNDGLFELHIEKPASPSRWLAFPLFGFLVRFILLIPYLVFQTVLQNAVQIAMLISWFAVLLKGKFPESLYEFERDTIRVSLASTLYMSYLSDRYPSFAISMQHKTEKILLLIAGALLMIINLASRDSETNYSKKHDYNKMHNYENMQNYDTNQEYDYGPVDSDEPL